MGNYERPPQGITPRKIWDSERVTQILGGIERRLEANLEIPMEWVIEYNELIQKKGVS